MMLPAAGEKAISALLLHPRAENASQGIRFSILKTCHAGKPFLVCVQRHVLRGR